MYLTERFNKYHEYYRDCTRVAEKLV